MKRLTALILALLLCLSISGCSGNGTVADTTANTEQTQAETTTMPQQITVDNPVTFFSMSMGETYDTVYSLNAYANEDGSIYVEYVSDEKKVGNLDAWTMHGIAAELEKTELAALNGTDDYQEGEANASMYIAYADGTTITAGYTGTIPQEYRQGYEIMAQYFAALTAELPAYVPEPQLMGEVDADLLQAMTEILYGSGIQQLDGFTISEAAQDEFFAYTVGLSDSTGVSKAVVCAPLMNTTAYSMVIVELQDGADAEAICDNFEANIDWQKWVCVNPNQAMIAQKGNMVLCLIGPDELFTQTVTGIQNAGWTEITTLKNPAM